MVRDALQKRFTNHVLLVMVMGVFLLPVICAMVQERCNVVNAMEPVKDVRQHI